MILGVTIQIYYTQAVQKWNGIPLKRRRGCRGHINLLINDLDVVTMNCWSKRSKVLAFHWLLKDPAYLNILNVPIMLRAPQPDTTTANGMKLNGYFNILYT